MADDIQMPATAGSGKSEAEIAFELLSKLKGQGVWGERNIGEILDMYAECLDATRGLRRYEGQNRFDAPIKGQAALTQNNALQPAQAAIPQAPIQQAPSQQAPSQQASAPQQPAAIAPFVPQGQSQNQTQAHNMAQNPAPMPSPQPVHTQQQAVAQAFKG